MAMLLFMSLGEWLEANAIGIVIAVVGWLGSIVSIVWYVSQAVAFSKANGEKLELFGKALQDYADDFDKHKTDGTIHTTFEFRQSVQGRLDRIEDEMKSGHANIEAKIDRWAEKMMSK